ncbi:hypothetical protein SISSUDRAFT_1130794 [Sistotremastrum suecicum HHB10207 ss-3]|uniref:Uncharacterized protein n=1 Tax=Sistotremastrum suecicum HHB10207 ss-3 TaxID=1314776 RepID=A0A166B029_9AGAM|nr:hypothetical protein SISSUDRAFT_1130794 [Sistotremastrum suecicum HHB10207 ss-3]
MPSYLSQLWKKLKQKITRQGQSRNSAKAAFEAMDAAQIAAAARAYLKRASTIWTLDNPSEDWTPFQDDEYQVEFARRFLGTVPVSDVLVPTTNPESRLPFEILSKIFELAARAHNNLPAVVVMVSKYWRSVALAHNPLWSYLWLDYRSPKEKYLLWKERLGNIDTPRSITIVAVARGQVLTEDWRYIEKELISLERAYKIRSFHFDGDMQTFRWCELKLNLNTFEDISLHMNKWDRFDISHSHYGCGVPPWPRSASAEAQPPKAISLRNVALDFTLLDFSQLTILELFDTENFSFPLPRDLMPALQTTTRLETLVIELTGYYAVEFSYEEYEIIRLAHLRHLLMKGEWRQLDFLAKLELPSLESLSTDASPRRSLGILRHTAPPLRRLCFSCTFLDPKLLDRIALYPSIISIHLFLSSLSVPSSEAAFIAAFQTRRAADPAFLPLLEHFETHNMSRSECLFPLPSIGPFKLRSTWGSESPREPLAKLNMLISSIVMQRDTAPPACNLSPLVNEDWKEEVKSRFKPRKRSLY